MGRKRLIALAGLVVSGATSADVVIFGELNVGLVSERSVVAGQGLRVNRVDDYGSIIGLKGHESLGNGLKAIWQVKQGLTADGTGNDTWASRDTFVGLEGAWGMLRLGRLKNAHDTTQAPDIIGGPDRSNDNRRTALRLDTYRRTGGFRNNSIRYDSPDLAGFQTNLIYAAGENRSAANPTPADIFGVGGRYQLGPYFGQLAHEYNRQPGAGFSDAASASRVEFGFEGERLGLSLGLQRTRGWGWDFAPNSSDTNAATITREVALSGSYQLGSLTPKLSYARGQNLRDGGGVHPDSGYRQWIVGVDYALSKRTVAAASYGRLQFGENAELPGEAANQTRATTLGLSLRHNF